MIILSLTRRFISLGLAALGLATIQAADAPIDFARDIKPILIEHCFECHGEKKQKSGLRVDSRSALLIGGDSGTPSIVPGQPEKSMLLDVINHRVEDQEMPPKKDKLPADVIAKLTKWIADGADWPGQMTVVAQIKSTQWSFQPVKRPAIPTPNRKITTGAIDAFLMAALAAKELSLSPAADGRSLIRRASITLTGLPPTPTQTSEFAIAYAADPNQAYQKLIDALMASPHFGERWAQHWLDVIRWAESNGSEANLYRKNAWVYRDYVIHALNSDKPYDQFIREQIAGDSLEAGEATGYLVSGPHVPPATVGREPSAIRQARADRMDEVMQTVGASVMGLTISCARCHNHKFDPISITDYYAMTAVFQDVEFNGRIPEFPPGDLRQQKAISLKHQLSAQRKELPADAAWEEDWVSYREYHVPAIETTALRISFGDGSNSVDELQIYGSTSPFTNIALAKHGVVTTVDKSLEDYRSTIEHINDDLFGTFRWAPMPKKTSGKNPWVIFTFPQPQSVHLLRLSSNREYALEVDYLDKDTRMAFIIDTIEARNPDGSWRVIAQPKRDKQSKDAVRKNQLAVIQKTIEQTLAEGPVHSFITRFIDPVPTHVFHRGSPEQPRNEVFPAGLAELGGDLSLTAETPGPQRRSAFATWITRPEHPLTARVFVNRVWHHIFGSGIVSTTSDFGAAGTLPSHPELLDWLAAELVQPSDPNVSPWSMKYIIRLMVMSQAFRQSSAPQEHGLNRDASATLLWRFPPHRMEAEVIRDGILLASGKLNPALGGISYRIHNEKETYAQWKVIDNHGPTTWRRMLYQERMRRVDDHLFTAFDFPDCGQIRAKRPVSTTPLQALNLLNSPFVNEQAVFIAERAALLAKGDEIEAIRHCFQLILVRDPSSDELKDTKKIAQSAGLSVVCRALINSNEFAFLP